MTPVHFIYLGGDFVLQWRRAIESAAVHGGPIWFWSAAAARPAEIYELKVKVELKPLVVPVRHLHHPIQRANVKDLYAYLILQDHGGVYLDLDTISLQEIRSLLTRQVLVSQEWPTLDSTVPEIAAHYNSAVLAAKQGAPILRDLAQDALTLLENGEKKWGALGPHLLTRWVPSHPEAFDVAPFGVLSGWRDDTIHEYYDGAPVPDGTRVIHCYQSSRPERFLADRRFM